MLYNTIQSMKKKVKKEGIIEGKIEGKTEYATEIVMNALKRGLDIDTISAITGLNTKKLKTLIDKNGK